MVQSIPDPELIQGFLIGDRKAFKQIESIIDKALTCWRVRLGDEIDEIKSEVIFDLYELLQKGQFQGRSKLSTFITSMVNNACIGRRRFNRKFDNNELPDVELPDPAPNAEEQLDRKQQSWLAFRVLRRLPRLCIKLWKMHLVEGLKYREIAERLGGKDKNIKWQLWSCREKAKKIREKLLKKDQLFAGLFA